MKQFAILLLTISPFFLYSQTHTFQLDGFFEDWENIAFIEKMPDPSNEPHLTQLAVANDEQYLYLRIKLDREIILQQSDIRLWIDADNDTQTGRRIEDMGAELFFHFGERFGFFLDQMINHFDIGLNALPTYSSDEFEIRITKEAVPLRHRRLITADSVKILFGRSDIPVDALPETGTLSYTLAQGPFPDQASIPLGKISPDHIRLMSYNILFDRPLEPTYKGRFQRIVKAIEADIFCFNEFFDASASQVKALIDEVLPLGTAQGWSAVKRDADNVIVSRFPILQAFRVTDQGNITACLIDLPEHFGTDLFLIVGHFSCCDLEESRQLQSDAVAALIEEAKNPGGRVDLPAGTPMILTGDLNLVGFRQQHTTLLTGEIQNTALFGTAGLPDWDDSPLTDLVPLHTEQRLATTWINPFSSFIPGRLDFFIYSDSRLDVPRSYILQSSALTFSKLSANGLLFDDTDFSDHLPIVADFNLKERVTSTAEIDKPSLLNLYPNPVSRQLMVENFYAADLNGTYSIFDADGRKLFQCPARHAKQLIDLSGLSEGIYFLEWRNGRQVAWKKLIKQ